MLAEGLLCRECRLVEPDFARAVAYGVYDEALRELIHLLKYDGVQAVARLLGGRLAEAILTLEHEAAGELLVVAVPLSPAAQKKRGYNQARLLADRALVELKALRPGWKLIPSHGSLTRQKSTETQFMLSRKARRRNLRGAFAVRGSVEGREVLLIDDILTTGSTARECARVLRHAGAVKVWVATVARAQSERLVAQQRNPGAYVAGWDLPVAEP